MRGITFYYDVVSPYSWIGFEHLIALNRAWNVPVRFVPFLLGGVMKSAENRPPATVPAKGLYMMQHDLPRLGRMHGMTLRKPEVFPALTLKAQRALAALEGRGEQGKLVEASRALWRAYWGGEGVLVAGKSVHFDPTLDEHVAAALGKVLPEELVRKLMEEASTPAVKERLAQHTEEALKTGAYGAPWIVVTDKAGVTHPFFGSDRFELLANEFGLPYPAPSSKSKL